MNGAVYFLALLTIVCFIISLLSGLKKTRMCLPAFLLMLPPLLLRFAPLLVGLVWRATVRPLIELISAILLSLWCIICIVFIKHKPAPLLIVITILLSGCMFVNSIFFPIRESIQTEGEIPSYVRENNDPGSLANVQYFRYVNKTFRALFPSYDLISDSGMTLSSD